MSGPGLLFVTSKITKPDVVSEDVFMKWYDTEHIPDLLATTGFDAAFRYRNVDSKADRPYMVAYPMRDIAFGGSDEFKSLRLHSKLFPDDGLCFNVADFDMRYYEHVQLFEPSGANAGVAKCVMAAAIEPGDATSAEEFDEWYRKQHLDMLSMTDGYVRSNRYRLSSAVGNNGPVTSQGLPTWLALHEFDTLSLPMDQIGKTVATEWAKAMLGTAKIVEATVYELQKKYGDGGAL